MEIILLERIIGLGHMGDIVNVKCGFARNFLLPHKKAVRSTEDNKKLFEKNRAEIQQKDLERKAFSEKISERLEGKRFTIIRSCSETGQLYGSVSSRDIATLLTESGFDISRNHVILNAPLKSIGIAEIKILLHAEVSVTIALNIARSLEEAEKQEQEAFLVQKTSTKAEKEEAS